MGQRQQRQGPVNTGTGGQRLGLGSGWVLFHITVQHITVQQDSEESKRA